MVATTADRAARLVVAAERAARGEARLPSSSATGSPAHLMADKIVVMRDGKVEQVGEALDLYDAMSSSPVSSAASSAMQAARMA
jgi:ABC-type molybdate transport system ATPase subunit